MFNTLNGDVPLRETNFATRRKRILENFKKLKENTVLNLENEKIEKENEERTKNSILAKNFGESGKKREDRKMRKERIDKTKILYENTVMEVLCEIFYESIILDEDFKEKYKGNLMETAFNFFEESFKKGLLNLNTVSNCKSATMRELFELCEANVEMAAEYDFDEGISKYLLEEVKTETKKKCEDVSEVVKDKVAKVVKRERKMAEKNKEDLADSIAENHIVRKKEEPSLFKSIMIAVSKSPLNENGTITNKIDMNMLFAESIVHYTLLEMLNTTKMLDLNANQVNSIARSYRFYNKK